MTSGNLEPSKPTHEPSTSADDVRAQLQRIFKSRGFRAAESLRNLLAFVVEETLAGREENLKEYLLGAMVLGKGSSFDPKLDPIVRVQMRRLRQRLQHYYATDGWRDSVVIALSRGSYGASIDRRSPLSDGDPVSGSPEQPQGDRPGFAAYEAHLRARYLLGQMSVTSIREAAALIEDLLQKDPSFGAAHATLAECYRAFLILEMMPPEEVIPRMKAACAKALTLDANSAEAHAAFAGVLAWEWNFVEAEHEYQLAVRCGPRNCVAHRRYAVHLAATQRFAAAVECAQRACELDPLSAYCEYTKGVVHYWRRDFFEALECAQRSLALAPHFGMGHHLLGFVCLHVDDYETAVDALERATCLSGASTFDRGYQAYGLGRAGEHGKAREMIEELVAAAQREYVAPLSMAHCYLGLGDVDEALAWVERAYVPGMSQWPYYLAAPFYEPLFLHRRFQAVLDRIGLPRPLAAT